MASADFEHELHSRLASQVGFRRRHPSARRLATASRQAQTSPSSGRLPECGGSCVPAADIRLTFVQIGSQSRHRYAERLRRRRHGASPPIGPAPQCGISCLRSPVSYSDETAVAVSWKYPAPLGPSSGTMTGTAKPTSLSTTEPMACLPPGRSSLWDQLRLLDLDFDDVGFWWRSGSSPAPLKNSGRRNHENQNRPFSRLSKFFTRALKSFAPLLAQVGLRL